MDAILTTVGNFLPYHLLSYGALLGTELYQSFVNTKICYRHLPAREFLGLNKRIFPVYFTCQIGLAALTAATRPPYSIVSLGTDLWSAAPLVIVIAMGSLNYFVYGPKTTTVSFVRRALHEKENQEDEKIQRVNKDFKRNHAMTIHLNAIALVATVWYGFSLSHALITGF
ncbi:uncharacterized protein N7484_003024 [Penicillium longicatenatum]|uniref:uncharacterized protein n=1 Tax=Penicillium longicatenatum TaxID=1561947 RepID=UPI002549BC9F|nr:uncharacterized protein N7484_003024 [Penicillium longicatenatum]KAJ5649301.1 hypothetical protein N7484_003024 [Penicillium longicatenatum]